MPEVFYPEGKKITVAGQEFTVKPFVLRVRTKVLRIITAIFVEASKTNPNIKTSDTQGMAAVIIEAAGDKLVEIYEIVLEKDREWLENNMTLKDEMTVIGAISEVNDIPFLVSQAKNLFAKKQ